MKLPASDPEAWFSKGESDALTIRKIMVGDDVPWDAVQIAQRITGAIRERVPKSTAP
jgi:hypothetical protein